MDKEKNGDKDLKKDVKVSCQKLQMLFKTRTKKIQSQIYGVATVQMVPIEAKMDYVLVKKHVKHAVPTKSSSLVVPHLVGSIDARMQENFDSSGRYKYAQKTVIRDANVILVFYRSRNGSCISAVV